MIRVFVDQVKNINIVAVRYKIKNTRNIVMIVAIIIKYL